MNKLSIADMCETALLCALITLSGAFKIPSFVPGTEFQLSAPIAVAICAAFGIKKYITAGILSSVIGLILGTQNIFSVIIALIFRVVVAIFYYYSGRSRSFYLLSGPCGTLIARLSLSLILGKAAYPLVVAAAPGMVFTAITSAFFAKAFISIRSQVKSNGQGIAKPE